MDTGREATAFDDAGAAKVTLKAARRSLTASGNFACTPIQAALIFPCGGLSPTPRERLHVY
jgi:hypothetical protein